MTQFPGPTHFATFVRISVLVASVFQGAFIGLSRYANAIKFDVVGCAVILVPALLIPLSALWSNSYPFDFPRIRGLIDSRTKMGTYDQCLRAVAPLSLFSAGALLAGTVAEVVSIYIGKGVNSAGAIYFSGALGIGMPPSAVDARASVGINS